MRHAASLDRCGVLVVEDDLLIRMIAVDFAAEAGFPVYEAGGAEEALRVIEQRGDIRALFTDVNMPGAMDGLALAHHVRRRWPSIALIVTSGRVRPPRGDLPPGSAFLPKPYRGAQLARMLQDMVDGHAVVP